MKNKSKKRIATLLALVMALGLFAAIPMTAFAEDGPIQVTLHPFGATYMLGDPAIPLKATFAWNPVAGANIGILDSQKPIKIQWYWSATDSNTSRANKIGPEIDVAYKRPLTHTTTITPPTDTVGVKYYYAVIAYSESVIQGEFWVPESRETVTNTARIEVVAPDKTEQSFAVKKVDEDGQPLAGAIFALEPQDGKDAKDVRDRTYEATSGTDGIAAFNAEEGEYILSEKKAPDGYNATDDKYYILITANGVFIVDPAANLVLTHMVERTKPYETATFVNKKIPALNPKDHFAYMQGYPEGDFRPEKNMTRAEAVVMFSRLLAESMDLTVDYYKSEYYPDVPRKEWYANYVCFMHSLGVLADYSRDEKFRPDEPVTRAEFATLASHFDNLTLTSVNNFTDVPDDHWAVKYINSAAAKGWIIGYNEGGVKTFKPENNITRAEVVTLVNRILARKADRNYINANISALPRKYFDLPNDLSHWAYWEIMEASIGHDFTKQGADEKWTAFYK